MRGARARVLAAAGAVLLLAAALRLPGVTAGYPYTAYVDEGNYLWPARFLYGRGGWDPETYLYPSLPLYAACAAAWTADVVRAARGLPLLRARAAERFSGNYDPFTPPGFLLAARVACWLASLVAVALTGWLAHRWRGPAAGLLAALIAALTPALVARGGIAIVDVWSALFVTACLVATDRLHDEGARRTPLVLCAGFLVACAAASKYPAVLVGCAPAVAIVLTRRGLAGRARELAALALACTAGLLVVMPAVWLRPAAVFAALAEQARRYSTLPWRHGYLHQAVVRMEEDLPFAVPELGWVFCLLVVIGAGIALCERGLRRRLAGALLFAALLLGTQLRYGYQPFRNLVPLVPLGAALAALPLCALRRRLATRMRSPAAFDALAAALLLLAFLPGAWTIARGRATLVDSRIEARRWLQAHVRPGDRVLVLTELRFLPEELAKLGGRVRVVDRPTAVKLARHRRFHFLVAGEAPPPGEPLPPGWPALGARSHLRASFGTEPVPPMGWWWYGNRVRIDVSTLEAARRRQPDRRQGERRRAAAGEAVPARDPGSRTRPAR